MSSSRQALLQARELVATAAWPDGAAEVVVGTSAYITPEISEVESLPGRLPFALINLGEWREDPEDPELGEQTIYIVLATAVGGHNLGEFAITGGPGRVTGTSAGRGITELQKPILQNLALMTGADDTVARIAPGSAGGMAWKDGQHMAWRQFVMTVICTVEDEWPAPRELEASGNVLSWTLPPSRFDLDSIVLRYAAGATAPTSETGGTGITLASSLATTHDVSALGAGTYSFALFAKYVDTNTGDVKYSAQETGSYRASVTVT